MSSPQVLPHFFEVKIQSQGSYKKNDCEVHVIELNRLEAYLKPDQLLAGAARRIHVLFDLWWSFRCYSVQHHQRKS